jgi:hypothetical protein
MIALEILVSMVEDVLMELTIFPVNVLMAG